MLYGYLCGLVFSMMRVATVLSLFGLLVSQSSVAQSTVGIQHLYPERLREDVEVLREIIHAVHPDPYRYRTKVELDRLIDSVSTSLTVPIDEVDFTNAVRPIFKAIGDSHCYSDLATDLTDRMNKNALLIPIQLRLLPDGIYVESELKGFRSIPPGSRLLSINGRKVEEIMDRLIETVITDGANRSFAERTVEKEFPERYHIYFDRSSSFDVEFLTPSGLRDSKSIFGLTREEINISRKPDGSLLPWAANWVSEYSTMWVTMNTLDANELALAGQRPERFLDALLTDLQKKNVSTVVLDLRGAGGRELATAELVFGAFAQQPFKLLSDMYARSATPPEIKAERTKPVVLYASNDSDWSNEARGIYRLPVNDPRLAENNPQQKAFRGKIYVVADGLTRDAAAAVVMLMRRTNRAKLVGEELGSNSFAFTGGEERVVRAPNSRILFHIPLLMYVPSGRGEGPKDRGEQPDHQAHQTPVALAKGGDSLKQSLLQMIDFLR